MGGASGRSATNGHSKKTTSDYVEDMDKFLDPPFGSPGFQFLRPPMSLLAATPSHHPGFLMVYDLQGDEDLEKNKMKKKKNQSALQRLKEKIRAKKQVG